MQSHHLPVGLARGVRSRALWATNPSRRGVLFVHGFGGDATGTWQQFPSLLPADPRADGLDVVFYGYDGLRTPTTFSASILGDLVRELLTRPADLVNATLPPGDDPRDPSFEYEALTIAAHSMGAVVARRALLDLGRDPAIAPALDRLRLVLYAPAHMGGDIIAAASELASVFKLVPVAPLARLAVPTLKDLEPGSATLAQLATHTTEAIRAARAGNRATNHLIAARVVHGQRDRVVSMLQFCEDPPMTPVPGRGHSDVCKPKVGFTDPLEYLF